MAVVNERPTIRNVPLRLFGICKPEGFYLPKKSFSYEVWVLTRRARKERVREVLQGGLRISGSDGSVADDLELYGLAFGGKGAAGHRVIEPN